MKLDSVWKDSSARWRPDNVDGCMVTEKHFPIESCKNMVECVFSIPKYTCSSGEQASSFVVSSLLSILIDAIDYSYSFRSTGSSYLLGKGYRIVNAALMLDGRLIHG